MLKNEFFNTPELLIGKFDNDLEMLKAADISVCPSNAKQSVKDICDHCLCSNNEGLIADVIEKIVSCPEK